MSPFPTKFRNTLVLCITLVASTAFAGLRSTVASKAIPESARLALNEMANTDKNVRSISFTPHGGWVILFDDNGFSTHLIPAALEERLKALAAQGRFLKSVAFTSTGGWVVLCDNHDFVEYNLPASLSAALKSVADRGVFLKSVSFTPTGGWVFLYGDRGYWANLVTSELIAKLKELFNGGNFLRDVTFSSVGWAILYDEGQVATHKLPQVMTDKLRELSAETAIKEVELAPFGGWVVIGHRP